MGVEMKFSGFLLGASFALLQAAASAQTVGSVERGRYLVEGILACSNCHVPRGPQGQPEPAKGMSGGMRFPELKAVASNITPDPDTGIGRWTDVQLGKAIREGIRPDGTVIGPPMPSEFYRHLSDEDLAHVIAYLRAQPAVRNVVAKSEYTVPLPPNYGPPLGRVTAPAPSDRVAYGKYLAEVGHCMECHTPRGAKGELLQGSLGAGGQVFKGPWGASVARNLSSHENGLKNWTDTEIANAIRSGRDRQGNPYKPPMAFAKYANVSDDDMAALVAYLRTVPPAPTGGGPR
jgi:mono/diheme cytochrome c family protein